MEEYDDVEIEEEEDDLTVSDIMDRGDEERRPIPQSTYKLSVEPDITKQQEERLEENKTFFGRHVALGNTKRIDNIKFMLLEDSANLFDKCPTLSQMATEIRGLGLTELQLMRSNPEVGGFERKAQITGIRRDTYDISKNSPEREKALKERKTIFGILKRKKE